ncbi:MAG: hypothetical protein WCJ87_12900, partial [Burkholderiales bacterium]
VLMKTNEMEDNDLMLTEERMKLHEYLNGEEQDDESLDYNHENLGLQCAGVCRGVAGAGSWVLA